MDTRFWGPSGWRLLHLITYTYDPITQRHAMRKFLEALPYILPCNLVLHLNLVLSLHAGYILYIMM
jgi:hypothetical protein